MMIARIWRGVTPESKKDEYYQYLLKTGVKNYRAPGGNRGVYVLRQLKNSQAEFMLISLWDSFEDIKKFAGQDFEKAVYYPEDKEFLLELEPNVLHYEVLTDLETYQES